MGSMMAAACGVFTPASLASVWVGISLLSIAAAVLAWAAMDHANAARKSSG